MKKISICILVTILLCLISVNGISQVTESKIYHKECKNCYSTFSQNKNTHHKTYPIFHSLNSKYNEISESNDNQIIIQLKDTPTYFSWKDFKAQDWTTPAKSQGACGSCSDFAAMSVLESVINIRENCSELNPDLSEQYVLSCIPEVCDCQHGGYPQWIYKYIMDNGSDGNFCNGIVTESCLPYQGIDAYGCNFYDCDNPPVLCSDKCENWEDYLIPLSDYGYMYPHGTIEDRQKIKNLIMEKGPVAAVFNFDDEFEPWGWTHHDPTEYYPYQEDGIYGHVIAIIGWNDDQSIPNGGYWICKNSWGTEWGYEGFFNIEYGSLKLEERVIAWVEYDPDSYEWQPYAVSNGPYYGIINEPVSFYGSAPYSQVPCSWFWDFGDGMSSEEQNPHHVYGRPGNYSVTLTVIDSNDFICSDTTFAWIQETNSPPSTPIIEGPNKGVPEQFYWYNISSIDPDNNRIYYYIDVFGFDFGWLGVYDSGEEFNSYYYWSEQGHFVVRAKAKDTYGSESDWAILEVNIPKSNDNIRLFFDRFIQNNKLFFQMVLKLKLSMPLEIKKHIYIQ